jgi:hypothetical protein
MAIKYFHIFQSKALKNLPKLGFLFENKPSGNPAAGSSQSFNFKPFENTPLRLLQSK